MKRDNWEVKEEGIRSEVPNQCFYCKQLKGSQHLGECVVRKQTVIVKVSIEMLITDPEYWDKDMVEFHKNRGSWCANNIIPQIEAQAEKMGCLCPTFHTEFIREATEDDEEQFGITVMDCKS